MSMQAAVTKTVKPIIGEKNWQTLRRVKGRLSGTPAAAPARAATPVGAPAGLAAISDDLSKLAQHFKTDKWGTHRYTQHYQRHLQHLRNDSINLLEIGIGGYSRAGQGGASLRMWKHFFPNAQIFGMDIQDKSFVDEDRITTFIGDQSDPDSLIAIADKIGTLDVIIDDGSHRSPHVLTTFETLFPLLRDGGIYAVEDTQTSYWPEWQGSEDRDDPNTSMSMLKRLADGLNYEEFVDVDYQPTYTDLNVVGLHFYHNLVIIEKGKNAEGTNKKRILKQRYSQG
ncbi:class I SAM-dependent methyltransferase [Streptomyces jeddahensis]|uniref:Demethylmacrocin O-methyltransferase n=1 Tax=Streptomyces jeddahensis TaxID=1716141 RepID=A0A177HHL2_9ACTN|nr:class I SAM-dependent methyltransferase [Streptomyces jeddahensis]OAH10090.1 demethylmacrocin O-methyltransferase [Streptomyces jeddahensis]